MYGMFIYIYGYDIHENIHGYYIYIYTYVYIYMLIWIYVLCPYPFTYMIYHTVPSNKVRGRASRISWSCFGSLKAIEFVILQPTENRGWRWSGFHSTPGVFWKMCFHWKTLACLVVSNMFHVNSETWIKHFSFENPLLEVHGVDHRGREDPSQKAANVWCLFTWVVQAPCVSPHQLLHSKASGVTISLRCWHGRPKMVVILSDLYPGNTCKVGLTRNVFFSVFPYQKIAEFLGLDLWVFLCWKRTSLWPSECQKLTNCFGISCFSQWCC